MKKIATTNEPDFKAACGWWPEIPNKWTPLGWRDHMLRFNVLWNGGVLATVSGRQERMKPVSEGLEALLLNFAPSVNAQTVPTSWTPNASSRRVDDGLMRQGWLADDVPVLWTEWVADGLVMRAEMFAHITGGGGTQRGDEPLFAWIRLKIHHLCHPLPLEPRYGMQLLLEDPWIGATMNMRQFFVDGDYHAYKRPLAVEPAAPEAAKGCRVVEEDGKVRIGVAPGKQCKDIVFTPRDEKICDRLFVELPVRKGAYADVLLPLVPCDREAYDREMAVGYDGARREANRFWKQQLKSATRFETPEADVNDVLRQSARISLNLTEKNPLTGRYCKINGSWVYADLWTTPMSMDLAMMMDVLGYHDIVRRYLDILKTEQGTVVPPGDGYELHPGYYSTPALYKSIDWLSDNGAVLWTICRHALLSGDLAFAREFMDGIVKSCDWIRENRNRANNTGYKGVLPPAEATDAKTRIQATWSVGWNHLGLCAAVQVLEWLGHPRAAEFAAEAKAYREDYVKALREKCKTMPTWKDAKGKTRRFVPMALMGDQPWETRHGFYLDTGPLFNVFSGLLPATDPLMQDTLAWFREGPQREFYRRDSMCWQVPALDREMSSCEPCYSWNVFHSWQLGERDKFLEGMYSLFAGGISQQTRVSCETRGGITGNVFAAPLAIWLARLAVIDDEIKANELHLLRLAPLAWLKPGDEGIYDAVPTIYGPVTLRTKVSMDGKTLDVTYAPQFRQAPKTVTLHIPPMPGLKTVTVNGKKVAVKGGGRVRLTNESKSSKDHATR